MSDPVERLRYFTEYVGKLKKSAQAEAATSVNEITALLPGTVTSVAVRAMTMLPQRALHSTVTNVQGPPMELYPGRTPTPHHRQLRATVPHRG